MLELRNMGVKEPIVLISLNEIIECKPLGRIWIEWLPAVAVALVHGRVIATSCSGMTLPDSSVLDGVIL